MCPQFYLFLFALVACPVISDVTFVYPPAYDSTASFSTNLILVEGDFKTIQWTDVTNPQNYRLSVTMLQLNGTHTFGDPEYITQNAVPDTISAPWTVNTSKNLTLSPMFILSLFFEGKTNALTNSHYFNITAKSTTTTTSSTSSSISSSTSSSQILTSGSPMPTISAASTPDIITSSDLSTIAKVGVAVGVIGATFLGALGAWLIFRRKVKMSKTERSMAAPSPPLRSELGNTEQQHELSSKPIQLEIYEVP